MHFPSPEPQSRADHFVFEVTQACNHDCLHCYNAWKNPVPYPQGALDTDATLDLLGKMLRESGANLVSLSGGEPLLRPDWFEIVDFLTERGTGVNLITNGSLMDESAIERLLPHKVSIFEIPLLSADRELHDRLSGAEGAFDRATMAMAELKAAEQTVVGVFVATRVNLPTWRETAELAVALGLDGLMFNRFNPGGRGREHIDLLQASPKAVSDALSIAQEMSVSMGLPVSCAIPMPPCLFEVERFDRLGFGFCAAGTEGGYPTLDPLGNVRPCNHSTTILGNLRETDFEVLACGEKMRAFFEAVPAFCEGCRYASTCKGGCKASAEVCRGSLCAEDPFLSAFRHDAVIPRP
ncbi:MAG: radical SAM protein [Planctomycetota bacterium]|jgi:radical SAM protein with 4Fe4S-binding SPASM domain